MVNIPASRCIPPQCRVRFCKQYAEDRVFEYCLHFFLNGYMTDSVGLYQYIPVVIMSYIRLCKYIPHQAECLPLLSSQ